MAEASEADGRRFRGRCRRWPRRSRSRRPRRAELRPRGGAVRGGRGVRSPSRAGDAPIHGDRVRRPGRAPRPVVASSASEKPVDYLLYEPRADTVVLSIQNAVIDPEVRPCASHPMRAVPVSLVTAFEQPETRRLGGARGDHAGRMTSSPRSRDAGATDRRGLPARWQRGGGRRPVLTAAAHGSRPRAQPQIRPMAATPASAVRGATGRPDGGAAPPRRPALRLPAPASLEPGGRPSTSSKRAG